MKVTLNSRASGGYTMATNVGYRNDKYQHCAFTVAGIGASGITVGTYVTIAFLPVAPIYAEYFTCIAWVGNKSCPVLGLIDTSKNVKVFVSDDLKNLGGTLTFAVNLDYLFNT